MAALLVRGLAIAALLLAATPASGAMHGIPGPLQITIVRGPCPDEPQALGCAHAADATVYVDTRDRFIVQHEIGHLFDAQRLDDRERGALAHLLHARAPWNAPSLDGFGDDSPAPARELFADAYAACRLGLDPERGEWSTSYDWYPRTSGQQRHVCAVITRFA